MERLIQELRAFIVENFLFGDESGPFAFSDDDSFQERGLVDSTGILELVCHLQEKYAIDIADDELVPDNLDSLSKVARFIQRKRQLQPVVTLAR
jgi:acyl carrier protein